MSENEDATTATARKMVDEIRAMVAAEARTPVEESVAELSQAIEGLSATVQELLELVKNRLDPPTWPAAPTWTPTSATPSPTAPLSDPLPAVLFWTNFPYQHWCSSTCYKTHAGATAQSVSVSGTAPPGVTAIYTSLGVDSPDSMKPREAAQQPHLPYGRAPWPQTGTLHGGTLNVGGTITVPRHSDAPYDDDDDPDMGVPAMVRS